jgi:hypothetical protein
MIGPANIPLRLGNGRRGRSMLEVVLRPQQREVQPGNFQIPDLVPGIASSFRVRVGERMIQALGCRVGMTVDDEDLAPADSLRRIRDAGGNVLRPGWERFLGGFPHYVFLHVKATMTTHKGVCHGLCIASRRSVCRGGIRYCTHGLGLRRRVADSRRRRGGCRAVEGLYSACPGAGQHGIYGRHHAE